MVLGSLRICRLYWLRRGNLACFLPVLAMPAHLLVALARMSEFSDISSLVGSYQFVRVREFRRFDAYVVCVG